MARPLRIQYKDACYHIFSRGNDCKSVFRQESDYVLFLQYLEDLCAYFRVIVHCYCLMKNHFHLLIQTQEANLSDFMKRLLGNYTIRFNRKHHRVGHLFQGRYKAIVVEKDNYLIELSRYIHLNPCKSGIVKRPEEYTWSSFKFYMGRTKSPSFLQKHLVLSNFKKTKSYREFVLEGMEEERDPLKNVVGGLFLGSEEFIDQFREEIELKSHNNVSKMKELLKIPVEVIEKHLKDEGQDLRMYALRHWGKLSHKEIGHIRINRCSH